MTMRAQTDRRRETRLLCADLVDVRWTGAAGEEHEETANLEDISDHGICLQLESEIPVGSIVSVAAGETLIKGEVRYCRDDELGYFVGVQLEGTWPKRAYRPRHLLDPRALIADQALRKIKP